MPKTTEPQVPLRAHDVLWITQRLPRNVREAMKKHGRKLILAGGFLRACIANERAADIDLFTTSKEYAEALSVELSSGDKKRVHTTENAFTIKTKFVPIQIIHRWTFDEPAQVVRSFDFTIASAAVWFETEGDRGAFPLSTKKPGWESSADAEFYSDLAGKRIVYRVPDRIEDAGGSILRVLKFYQRGYRIPLDSLGEIVARLVKGVRAETLRDASEEHVARVLTGLLREVDPMIDPDHIAHLPSDAAPEEEEEAM